MLENTLGSAMKSVLNRATAVLTCASGARRAVRALSVVGIVALAIFVAAGCGGGSGSSAGPKTAGDPEALVGTSWKDPKSNMVYNFKDASNIEAVNPDANEPVQGSYSVDKGIISGNIGLQNIDGAWDGTAVVMKIAAWDGKAMVMQDRKLVRQ